MEDLLSVKLYEEYNAALKSAPSKVYPQLISDLVRLTFLQEHGGLWIDLTSIFIESFDWLELENLLTNPHIINRNIAFSEEPDVLMFYIDYHQYKNIYYRNNPIELRNNFPGY